MPVKNRELHYTKYGHDPSPARGYHAHMQLALIVDLGIDIDIGIDIGIGIGGPQDRQECRKAGRTAKKPTLTQHLACPALVTCFAART